MIGGLFTKFLDWCLDRDRPYNSQEVCNSIVEAPKLPLNYQNLGHTMIGSYVELYGPNGPEKHRIVSCLHAENSFEYILTTDSGETLHLSPKEIMRMKFYEY